MTLHFTIYFGITLLGCTQVQGYTLQPTECRSQADCGTGECCVLGMVRYSMAQCMPVGQVEDYCREDNPPDNKTLYYPDQTEVQVTDIYTHVCPCDDDLQCIDNFCAMDDSYDHNYLY